MPQQTERKERLHRLIDFARVYRGWSRQDTAKALSRDSTKLYPNTDNPKLDILLALSAALDWSIDDVVQYVWSGDHASAPPADGEDFDVLDAEARAAHMRGEYSRMTEIARRMFRIAGTAEQRARACNREHGAWDGLGRYTQALEAACRGLQQTPIPAQRQYQLQANLANTHYTLWELTSALAHSHIVVQWYRKHLPKEQIERKTAAFAYYVRGQARRRLAAQQPHDGQRHYLAAKADLTLCAELHDRLADEFQDERLRGIGHTCRGGLLEVEVELGQRDAQATVAEFLSALEDVIDPSDSPVGDWLESYGWWSVFGANVALRRLSGRDLQQSMAIFTNKALEIADRLDNWALRERVFSMQYKLHETLADATGLELPYVVDDEDRRLITGAMGRFPAFRDTGWRIFRAAKVVKNDERN
jgi:hypothetical protein